MPQDLNLLLTQCDTEPLHLCGAIQPHGFLVSTNRTSGTVEFASENVSTFMGISYQELFALSRAELSSRLKSFNNVSSFISGENEVYEIEPLDDGPTLETRFLQVLDSVSKAPDLVAIFNLLASGIRQLSCYERVMVYRFEDDWAGTVVGESIEDDTYESFMNLRFPAQDIPEQARQLYRLNDVRYIPSVSSAPCPIVSRKNKSDLDLSLSLLRAVSPVHLEYLRNMQVGASMSISLIIDGKLWGLVACHNRTERHVSPPARETCTVLCRLCSQIIHLRVEALRNEINAESRKAQLDLLNKVSAHNNLEAGISLNARSALELVSATGMVLQGKDDTYKQGLVAPEADLEKILDFLDQLPPTAIFSTDELTRFVPDLSEQCLKVACGILAAKVADHGSWIFWFRPAITSEINWAGEPIKLTDEEMKTLHPRRSFKIWKEQVYGKSKGWSSTEVDSALVLADYLKLRIAAESRFSMALEASSQSMLVADASGKIISGNAAALNLLGVDADALTLNGTLIDEILKDGVDTTSIINKAGSTVPVNVERSPLSTAEGLFYLYMVSDISEKVAGELERVRLTEALKDSNQKMEQFVDTIAHDLRAPLLSITNLAQWIESDLGDNLKGAPKDNLSTLRQRALRMREQLTSLLDYSKSGSSQAIVEEVDAKKLVQDVVDSIESTRNYKIHLNDLPVFQTVKAPLEHVFHNLIENATKYAGLPGSVITVSCLDSGEFFQFSVVDTGKGIPIEYQEEVFYPMRSLGGADQQGHGMGLAFVKRIVEQSGGKVKLSSSPGKGANFSFSWRKTWKTE